MASEQNSKETKSAAERMWGEMLPFVQAMLEEEDAEFANITIEDCFNGIYGREADLDLKTRELCTIAMLAALGNSEELDIHFMVAFHLGWTYAELRELLTLIVIPAGWPCAIDALRKLQAWCKANHREKAPGVPLREGFDATDWYARGKETGQALFGKALWESFQADLDLLHTDLRKYMVSMFYGKLMTRTTLDEKTRQLCLVAAFTAQRAGTHLALSVCGALGAGASEAAIKEIFFYAGIYAGHEAVTHAISVWKQIALSDPSA
jgi:4-carboxymuconolactone decarboxylase